LLVFERFANGAVGPRGFWGPFFAFFKHAPSGRARDEHPPQGGNGLISRQRVTPCFFFFCCSRQVNRNFFCIARGWPLFFPDVLSGTRNSWGRPPRAFGHFPLWSYLFESFRFLGGLSTNTLSALPRPFFFFSVRSLSGLRRERHFRLTPLGVYRDDRTCCLFSLFFFPQNWSRIRPAAWGTS